MSRGIRRKIANQKGSGTSRARADKNKVASIQQRARDAGTGYAKLPSDSYPKFTQMPCEKIIDHGNCQITFGVDRIGILKPGKDKDNIEIEPQVLVDTGYGQNGEDGCYMIDIVAGRQSLFKIDSLQTSEIEPLDAENLSAKLQTIQHQEEQRLTSGPSFVNDAARIYIAQKTDVDRAFGIINTPNGSPAARSAVAIKADAVRIIGREGIKLVTYAGEDDPLLNSLGGPLGTRKGIDLVGANIDTAPHDLQPLVKGYNLVMCLQQLMESNKYLKDTVVNIVEDMKQMSLDMASHIHLAGIFPPGGSPCQPSAMLIAKKPWYELTFEMNKALLHCGDIHRATVELSYLESSSKTYICSTLNNAN